MACLLYPILPINPGSIIPYVGKPRYHGDTLKLYAGKDLAVYYLLGWKDKMESSTTIAQFYWGKDCCGGPSQVQYVHIYLLLYYTFAC